MNYIKIGSAYFQKNKIKGYHLREIVDKDGVSQWQVRADTMQLRIFDSKLKAVFRRACLPSSRQCLKKVDS